jgi:hypothetical protein
MSSPGIRSREIKPAASPSRGKGPSQALRLHAEDRAAPSIAMPRAKTGLTEMLAGDELLCVRPPAVAAVPKSGVDASPRPESPAESLRDQTSDADLRRVIDAWPDLGRGVRTAILAIVRDTVAGGG